MKHATQIYIAALLLAAFLIPLSSADAQHYRYPEWVERPDDMTRSCHPYHNYFDATVKARSRILMPDINLTPIRYHLLSGPGEVDAISGEWFWHPADCSIGETHTVVIAAIEGSSITPPSKSCRFTVAFSNVRPQIHPISN